MDLWNSACGLLLELGTLIEHGLVGIVGTVWSAAEASVVYIDQVGHALAKLAVDVVQATVGALKAVGGALEGALQWVLKVIEAEVDQLLTAAFAAIKQEMSSLLSAFITPLAEALCSCTSGGSSIISTPTSSLGDALFGGQFDSLFDIMTVIAVSMLVVMTVLDVLSLGTASLANLLIPIVVVAVLMDLAGAYDSQVGDSAGAVYFDALGVVMGLEGLIYESILEHEASSPGIGPVVGQLLKDLDTVADLLDVASILIGTPFLLEQASLCGA